MSTPPYDRSDDRTPAWRRYLRFWRSDPAADVAEELRFHLEARIEENIAAGMAPDDARLAALERFGDLERIRHALHSLSHERETNMQRMEWFGALTRDIRFGFRQLAKRPGFTAAAVLTLALGIGANTAIFSAVHAVLLRPLPVRDLDRIVVVQGNLPGLDLMETAVGPGEALDLIQRQDLFEAAAGFSGQSMTLVGEGVPRRLNGVQSFGRFFDVFGVQPRIGRVFRPDETAPGQHQVIVLSHGLWQELGGTPDVIGRRLELSGQRYEVIGVMGPEFRYPRTAQYWVPFVVDDNARADQRRMSLFITSIGKLRPNVSMEQFGQQLTAEARSWHERLPNIYGANSTHFLSFKPFVEYLAGTLRDVLLILMGAVLVVLLIACANVASLQLVHATARTKELAVRSALGAGRGIIARQLLVESLVLSALGGLAGLAVGRALLGLLARYGSAQVPALESVRLDGVVFAFAAAATLAAGLLFGLVPALRATRVDVQQGLKETTRGASAGVGRNRMLQSAVVVQMAMTMVLLLGSGLMIRSLGQRLTQDPGFSQERVVTMRVTPSPGRYSGGPAIAGFYQSVLDQLRDTPGIEAAGLTFGVPFTNNHDSSPFSIIGRPWQEGDPVRHANLLVVGGDYFRAMGIPLLRGRAFDRTDTKESPKTVVIDEQLAREFFQNEDPVGKQISQGQPATIIGVVGHVNQEELGGPPKATVYHVNTQNDWLRTHYLAVRSALPPAAVTSLVRTVVAREDANAPIFDVATTGERVQRSLGQHRLAMAVLSGFAGLSLLLALFGLYGVISYAVSQRTHEFGIRIALGAPAIRVRGMVVRQGAVLATTGIVLGLGAAFVATRVLEALLFGVGARDPLTFGTAAVALAAVAVLASYLPARRATKVDPIEALRG